MTNVTANVLRSFSGWKILLGLMLAYGGICGNVTYAYGVFLPSLNETFQWNRSTISGPYTLFLLLSGLLGPLVGYTIARYGARKNIIVGNILAAIGLLGMSGVNDIWHVYFFFGVLGGLGLAFAEFLSVTTIVNHWFIRKRSLAMGFLFASGGFGGFLLPPIISLLISCLGWRWTYICLAFFHLILTVLLGGMLIRNKPEDEGQLPDGELLQSGRNEEKINHKSNSDVYSTPVDWNPGEAWKTSTLWILTIIFSILLIAVNILSTHQVAYLRDMQYSPLFSASALGLMLGMSILGRLLSGILGMRFDGRYLASGFMFLMVIGILSLLYLQGIFFIYLYSICTGIGFGGIIVLLPNIISAYFGRKYFSQILGWVIPVVTLASAVSPTLAGFFYDRTGSYFLIFVIMAALLFGSGILVLLARPPLLQATQLEA